MPFEVPEMLSHYLMPLLIAVPLAIVVIIISRRRGDDEADEAPPAQPVRRRAAPGTVQPFVNTMPVMPAPGVEIEPEPESEPQPASLLLVDDSAVARAKLGKLFGEAGYRVTLAKDGVDALQKLEVDRFDVLVTDLEMPNKDGFELIAAVQGAMATENLPIIAITGHEELSARVHEVQGLYGIFKKPWNDRELLKRVEALASLHASAKA